MRPLKFFWISHFSLTLKKAAQKEELGPLSRAREYMHPCTQNSLFVRLVNTIRCRNTIYIRIEYIYMYILRSRKNSIYSAKRGIFSLSPDKGK